MLYRIKTYLFVFEELVKRDFKLQYKHTILGMGWSIVSPLLHLLVMRLVFTQFFGSRTPHYTTYLFAGNLYFSFFTSATISGKNALVANRDIILKIKVPKVLFLLSSNVSALINFGLTLVIFFFFAAWDKVAFSWKFITVLYPTICLVIINLGVGMILSVLYVMFEDIGYLYDIFTTLLMYMSAIFYNVEDFSPLLQKLFLVNPVYDCIKYVRLVMLEGTIPSVTFHLLLMGYAVILFSAGCLLYKKMSSKLPYYL